LSYGTGDGGGDGGDMDASLTLLQFQAIADIEELSFEIRDGGRMPDENRSGATNSSHSKH
jgi:hypothetical protein